MENMLPTETVTQIIEMTDYTPILEDINAGVRLIVDASALTAGLLLFFAIVVLCYFVYKFFRIFF